MSYQPRWKKNIDKKNNIAPVKLDATGKPTAPTLASFFNGGQASGGLVDSLKSVTGIQKAGDAMKPVQDYLTEYQAKYGTLPTMEDTGYNAIKADVTAAPGETEAAKAAYAAQGLDEALLRSRLGKQAAGAQAQVQARLASRGGLSGGAAARMGASSLRDIMMGKQALAGSGARDRASILQKDVEAQRALAQAMGTLETNRFNARAGAQQAAGDSWSKLALGQGALTNEQELAKYHGLQSGALQDAGTAAQGITAGNDAMNTQYGTAAGIYGGEQSAQAMENIANAGAQSAPSQTPVSNPAMNNLSAGYYVPQGSQAGGTWVNGVYYAPGTEPSLGY